MNTIISNIRNTAKSQITAGGLLALDRLIVGGFLLATCGMGTMVVFAQHIFADGTVYAPSLLAALIGQICFITAHFCYKVRERSILPEGSVFFTLLGIGFLMLALMTCLLHSIAAEEFLSHHLSLIRAR